MILATHHGPAIIRPPVWLLNVDFLAEDVIRTLEVGWTFNEKLKTKSFVLVWSTLGEEKASGPSISVIDPPSHKSGFKMSNWQNRNYDNYLRTRNLGARWAPISSWWPSATLFGPSGLLDFLFHALRALKPCFLACEGRWVKNVTE